MICSLTAISADHSTCRLTCRKPALHWACNMQLVTHIFSRGKKKKWIHKNSHSIPFVGSQPSSNHIWRKTIHFPYQLRVSFSWEDKSRGDPFISKFWACSIWSALRYAIRAIHDTFIFYRLTKHRTSYFNILYFKTGRSQSTKLSPFCHTQATNTCLTVEGQSLVAYMKSE